ncbi:CRISPR-associated endonuclease Cas2 [Sulfuracidifex metallicus]|uniref:CRISPR-associated endoribonuclease Cas2 n=1 Tax=Sulfuracidifex metallicus DSM 6482 = JCM 9184 TaxID=523847 RepID=A0A6A9QN52_SULME|nr:CRISPR-associated endonuclease Cas2 [Sulfuracidifex metallicus]MUN29730.1 CRISPR-associated endonuclease Cas2 [Sulfuracidifex metallicus DSM 6482 = JCM 9184]WOE49757.1 CRISPR-associated endonuclease Cas2 [Sulfuracidifex metallicus DSM 6482 = JCM 9184]
MVYVILVYDIDESRVAKVLKICRKYLIWVQRSVFEGEITDGNLELLQAELGRLIKDEDSVMFYITPTKKNFKRKTMGKSKEEGRNIL